MSNKIQIKRGVKAKLPVLSVGEPAFTTDTKEFFIGDGVSNVEFAKQVDLQATNNQLSVLANKVNSHIAQGGVSPKLLVRTTDPGSEAAVYDVWLDLTNNVFKVKQSDGTWKMIGAAYN